MSDENAINTVNDFYDGKPTCPEKVIQGFGNSRYAFMKSAINSGLAHTKMPSGQSSSAGLLSIVFACIFM